jgi:hypothetical protein
MMRRQAPNTWVSQHRSDTLFRDPGAMAGEVLRTFTRPALLSCFTTYPFKDLFFIHGCFEHQPKSSASCLCPSCHTLRICCDLQINFSCSWVSQEIIFLSPLLGLGTTLASTLNDKSLFNPSVNFIYRLDMLDGRVNIGVYATKDQKMGYGLGVELDEEQVLVVRFHSPIEYMRDVDQNE